MFSHLSEGFALGISLGATCFLTCGPVVLSFLLRREHSLASSFLTLAQILIGRFVGYSLVGVLAGALGGMIPESVRVPLGLGSIVVLGAMLVYYGVKGGAVERGCPVKGFKRYATHPILLGFLTGLEVCPPFILAAMRAATSGGAIAGFTLFIGFFAGTSIFMLPIAFFGVASSFKGVRVFGAIASVIVGMWFVAQGTSGIVLNYFTRTDSGEFSIVGVQDAPKVWIFSDDSWGDSLAYALGEGVRNKVVVANPSSADSVAAVADTLDVAIWLADGEPDSSLSRKIGVIAFDGRKSSQSVLQFAKFLSIYYFKRHSGRGFLFRWRNNEAQTEKKGKQE